MREIILASASPRRKELLEKAGISFSIRIGNGEEVLTTSDPVEAVKELSRQKAEAVACEAKEGTLIIGADTVVVYDGRILGKPIDEKDAFHTLQLLQGNTHQVYTGVTVLIRQNNQWEQVSFAEQTDVSFYPVEREEIQEYIDAKEIFQNSDGSIRERREWEDKAGSYGIQGTWGIYVKGICGDYSNVVGLPVARLLYEMKKIGINLREKE